jgi:hypothetical protein
LKLCGQFKLIELQQDSIAVSSGGGEAEHPSLSPEELSETSLLLRALMQLIFPKMVQRDIELLNGLFPR